jgi:hypothetical protein
MNRNRLRDAASTYLLAAAHQPIAWHVWGPDAFAEARATGRPVLLDIGAAWCHWCHVMDAESYEDPGLAEYVNRHFVCVKVDRDERPDVDARYQRAVQAVSGQGGWPLTAFLTPEGEVFFGGTYFPPDGRYGRPGFRTVLERVTEAWRDRRGDAVAQAAALREGLEARGVATAPGPVGPAQLLAAERRILAGFDPGFGGFGSAPKFPHPAALRFLMRRWIHGGSSETRLVVEETLRAMARGGFHDQLGGGFHRYSVDRQWVVPHFEKMASDNAALLVAYVEAAALFQNEEYAEVARRIVRWVREELAHPEAGYAASQDADIGAHDDGSYFTWTSDEIGAALPAEDADLARRHFGIGTTGEMPHQAERNVLFVAADAEALARATGRPVAEIGPRLGRIRDALRAARASRRAPSVDAVRYTSWNAMMASALLRAAPVLDDAWARGHALATLRWLKSIATGPAGSVVPHAPGGVTGLLEDQAHTADAGLDAFEATGDATWLAWSAAIMEQVWTDYRADESGALLDVARDRGGEGLLISRLAPIEDAPGPSPAATAASVFARLGVHTGDRRWEERHRASVEAFAGHAPALGVHAATWLLAADRLLHPPTVLVITGAAGAPIADRMHQIALASAVPRRAIRRLLPDVSPDDLPPELKVMLAQAAGARGFVCVGSRCLAPVEAPEEWRHVLESIITARPD